jgi:putative inorganic carbon (hco3(-)) transporter
VTYRGRVLTAPAVTPHARVPVPTSVDHVWRTLFGLLAAAGGAAIAAGGVTGEARLITTGAILAAAGVVVLAGIDFAWFLAIVIATRSALDITRPVGDFTTSSGLAVAFSLTVMAVAVAWIVVQVISRRWMPVSYGSRAFCVLAVVALASAAVAVEPAVSLENALRVLFGAVMLLVVEQVLRQRPDRVLLLYGAVVASLIVPLAAGLSEIPNPRYGGGERVQASFATANTLATFASIVALMALALAWHLRPALRPLAGAVGAACAALIIASGTRAAWIALVPALVVVAWCTWKPLVAVVAVAIAGSLVAFPSIVDRFSDLNDERVEGLGDPSSWAFRTRYWDLILPLHDDNPVLGIGIGMVEETRPERLEPHNVGVQAWVEMGWVGTLALVGVAVAIGVDLWRASRTRPQDLWRGVLVGGIAVAVFLLVQTPSENLLTSVVTHVTLAVPLGAALSLAPSARRDHSDWATGTSRERPLSTK